MTKEVRKEYTIPRYSGLTLDETVRLIICITLDVAEYAVPILLTPLVGDTLDILGTILSIILFGWYGIISILEFLPLADYFPIFILIWFIWYYKKIREEEKRIEKMKQTWK